MPGNIENMKKGMFKKGENGTRSAIAHRPKNRIKEIVKMDPISVDDRKNLASFLLNATAEEVRFLMADKTQPMFVVQIARAMLEDAKKGHFNAWKELLDWSLGSAVQPTVNVTKIDLLELSDEEYEARKAAFLKDNLPLARKMAAELKPKKPAGRPKKTQDGKPEEGKKNP